MRLTKRRDRTGRVTGITGRADAARLEVGADLVVGADGRHSAIARHAGAGAGLDGGCDVRHPVVQWGLIALVLVLAMAVWFSASAVVPALARQWHLSAGAAAWLTTPVQAGFVLGADSGVFSTLLSELADRRYVGTALTAQTAIGFLLTIVTIQLIPLLAGVIGWRYAFVALAAGPMTALPAMTALNRRMRRNLLAIPIIATERTSP